MDTPETNPTPATPVPGNKPAAPAAAHEVAPHDDAALTQLHPNYVHSLRLTAILTAIPVLIGGLVFEAVIVEETPIPAGVVMSVLLVLSLIFIIRVPMRRFNARGYNMSADRLRVVRGILWNSDTVVPFGRVQHIDVDQGPIERFFDLATLTVHTAGSHNASVHLPGLNKSLADDMREDIRAHIKRDTM